MKLNELMEVIAPYIKSMTDITTDIQRAKRVEIATDTCLITLVGEKGIIFKKGKTKIETSVDKIDFLDISEDNFTVSTEDLFCERKLEA